MPGAFGRLRHRVGHRGSALLFFACLDLVYCHSLLLPSAEARSSPLLTFLASLLPLWAWAAMWGAVGAVCAAQSVRRHDQLAFTGAIGLKALWGVVTLASWLIGGVDRGYVAATVWLAFAAFVAIIASWPEPPAGWKEAEWRRPSS